MSDAVCVYCDGIGTVKHLGGLGAILCKCVSDELRTLRSELAESARLHGMGSEREAKLMAEVVELKVRLERAKTKDDELVRVLNEVIGSGNQANPHLGIAAGAALLVSERDALKAENKRLLRAERDGGRDILIGQLRAENDRMSAALTRAEIVLDNLKAERDEWRRDVYRTMETADICSREKAEALELAGKIQDQLTAAQAEVERLRRKYEQGA